MLNAGRGGRIVGEKYRAGIHNFLTLCFMFTFYVVRFKKATRFSKQFYSLQPSFYPWSAVCLLHSVCILRPVCSPLPAFYTDRIIWLMLKKPRSGSDEWIRGSVTYSHNGVVKSNCYPKISGRRKSQMNLGIFKTSGKNVFGISEFYRSVLPFYVVI